MSAFVPNHSFTYMVDMKPAFGMDMDTKGCLQRKSP